MPETKPLINNKPLEVSGSLFSSNSLDKMNPWHQSQLILVMIIKLQWSI